MCSVVSDSATSWIVAHQAPLFMGFSRQGYWSGVAIPFSRRIFPTQGLNPRLLNWQADFFFFFNHWAIWEALSAPISVLKIQIRSRLKKWLVILIRGGGFSLPIWEAASRRFWPSKSKLRFFQTATKTSYIRAVHSTLFFFFFGIIFWSYELCFSALIQLPYRCILPEGPDLEDLCPVFFLTCIYKGYVLRNKDLVLLM